MIHYTCKHEFVDGDGNQIVDKTYWDSTQELQDHILEKYSNYYVQCASKELMPIGYAFVKDCLALGLYITLFFTDNVVFIYPSEDEEND